MPKSCKDLLLHYFPELTDHQTEQFDKLVSLYHEWNEKINVISRKDIELLPERHILHSLAIVKLIKFNPGTEILDAGTGGGFPGLPLAIMFPESRFHLVDSIGKKIRVVEEIRLALELKNMKAEQNRMEQLKGKYDFVISRAVAPIRTLHYWTGHLLKKDKGKNELANGFIMLKGGDLTEEMAESGMKCVEYKIGNWFSEPFFETKKIIHATPL